MTSAVEIAIELRPFRVDIPQEAIDDLRGRIAATRATMQNLVEYRGAGYDYRRFEARLNELPQSSPRSTVSTSTSSTFALPTRTGFRSPR